jgi:hypothetical protein
MKTEKIMYMFDDIEAKINLAELILVSDSTIERLQNMLDRVKEIKK